MSVETAPPLPRETLNRLAAFLNKHRLSLTRFLDAVDADREGFISSFSEDELLRAMDSFEKEFRSWEPRPMKLQRASSHGPAELLNLAEALIAYARDRNDLESLCAAIWPKLRVYRGNTHWRFMPTGESHGNSFFVDFAEPESRSP